MSIPTSARPWARPRRCGRSSRTATGLIVARSRSGFPVGGYREELARPRCGAPGRAGIDTPLDVELDGRIRAHAVQRNLKPLGQIKNIVAVASGKGGVGKSTVAANLALAWAAQGARVGLLDADIYGPSQPLMLGLDGPAADLARRQAPRAAARRTASRRCRSAFWSTRSSRWSGAGRWSRRRSRSCCPRPHWGELDYLVVDMPPGTGDIQLTLAQRVPVAGAVIVTTPQDIALADARKGLKMFEKVAVPVLGIVENMSMHVCSNCGHVEHIFGAGGGARMAAQYGVALLGELPLDAHIREEADGGRRRVVAAPGLAARHGLFRDGAAHRRRRSRARARDRSSLFPKIVVEES